MTKARANWKVRIVLFFISQCITLFGSQIVQMAIVWYVTLKTNSGIWIAAFSVCSYLPQFFISFLGGVWADRYNRKYLIICADALIAAVTLAMVVIMPHITAESALLTALLLMSAIRSAGAGIQNPAVSAVIPHLVPEDQLMRYNGINATMQSAVQFAAPAAAAVVLTANTLRATLLIDIVTALVGVGLLTCIRLPKENGSKRSNSVLVDMGMGIRYAGFNKAVRNTLIVYGLFLFWSVPAGYLAGLFVSRVYGESYWYLTVVELVGFGGMMAGGLLMSLWQGFKQHKARLTAGLSLFGAMAIAMGVSRNFAWYLVLMAVYGIALTAVQTTITTMLQECTQPSMQGRIFGLMSSIYAACYPIGMAVFGPIADNIEMRVLMIFSGIALMAAACFVYCNKHYKSMGE